MNWPIIISTGILLLALIIFLVRRNVKDEKVLEDKLDNDYPKANGEGVKGTIDEIVK